MGNPDVVSYGDSDHLHVSSPSPVNHGSHYFIGGPANGSSALAQDIDVSAGSAAIDTGNVVFSASGYLGGIAGDRATAGLLVAFQNVSGQTLNSVTLGPVNVHDDAKFDGLYYRRQIGLVPAATRKITITIQFTGRDSTYNNGAADSVSLTLNTPGSPQSVLGNNLIVNADAEAAPAVNGDQDLATDVPGWSRSGQFDVERYRDDQLAANAPGPQNRGRNYFSGGPSTSLSTGYQDIDVSSAMSLIDSGTVLYNASAWLGGFGSQDDNAVLAIQFKNWSGSVLGSAQLGPVLAADRNNQNSLLQRQQSGLVPSGTRQIHVVLTMTRKDGSYNDGYADNLSLVLGVPSRPSINTNGVITVSAFGGSPTIAPGSWIEIYGTNMSTTTRDWAQKDFVGSNAPTSLDGVSVSVGGRAAFVDYVSPGQVDALVPSDVGTGPVQVTVTNAQGTSDPVTVMVKPLQPSLLAPPSLQVKGRQYAAAFFPDGETMALPEDAVPGVRSRAAKPGDTLVLYGVGFGPVNPAVPAGTIVNQMTSLATPLQITFGNTPAGLAYSGLAPGFTGLYQFNVVVPSVPDSDAVPISLSLGGVPASQTLYIAVHR